MEFDEIYGSSIFNALANSIILSRQLHLYIAKDINPFQQLYNKWHKDISETEKDTKSNDLWLIYSNQTAIMNNVNYLESFTPVQLRLDSLVFLFYFDRTGILKIYAISISNNVLSFNL